MLGRMFLLKLISISSSKHLTAMVSSVFTPVKGDSREVQSSDAAEERRNKIRNKSLIK